MTDHETDPQRSPAPADAEPSHHTAELPRLESGTSDSSSTPAAASVPADSPAAGTSTPAGHTNPAESAGNTAPAGPYPPQPATPSAPPYPASGQPHPWYGQQHQQGGWNQQTAAGYPSTQHGGPVPSYQAQPYQTQQGYQSYQPGQPMPQWGPQQPARPSRAGKFVGAGALALVLMLGSGAAGGALALALDGDGPTRTYSAAPVINSADLPKIAASVQDSIVTIMTNSGEGSGVILSADGFVLTNNHVVAGAGGDTVRVVFADGKSASAKIVGTDPKTDLAVVQASGVSNLKAAKFGDSDAMQVGDQVLALGSPLGLQGSVTAGILSARDRTIQAGEGGQQNPQQGASSISGLLQTDAPINPGNSGGALVNTRGEVIGINTAIATAGQGSTGNIGVGFAIPSNKAKNVAEKLQRGEKISHPSLGVSVNGAEDGGALVAAVTPGSPAEKAGIQRGDVITKFGDKVINDSNDLVGAVQAGKVGDRVEVQYKRNGSTENATVTLAETS
ncbi:MULTISPECIES: S1C family serine protease [Micromonospora]|uniref:S1C family serine protease n=1 Tax=Micromonospora TaxID=1873 RepID=UPI0001BF2EDB|nr:MULTISPECIES: trypsin-like peptidase domain-containing protein [Micromonospora]ADL48718.1 peptidase S1 and S6 chymotrypsin/Hap [Micromonospora aurantiaca ATCC 27029]ADU08597.1 peptidase S1 and S6 chymotrypsin/Hap [Micromonospora sp. L5]MBC9002828.1 trypsin-like peptidase domain-containing protein [Micromonospora aurantiaca]MDG4754017.1 trypsin-like peptidase domain-containing protein [Micromonospora sp. WMMD718]SCL41697.1 putative serine protease PepD [Micromonospora aurantiaca]